MVRSIYEIDPAEIKMQKVQDIQDVKPKASKRKQATPSRVDPGTVPDETIQKPKRVRKPKADTTEPVVAEEPKPKPARKKAAPKQETTPAQSESSGPDHEEEKPKKSRKKKAEEPAPVAEETAPPAKKPRTEKQIAADLKRKEAAQAKREQAKAEKEALMEEALAQQEKAREKAEKRKAAAAARKAAKGKDEDELPGWFKNYVKTVAKKEQEFVAPDEKPKVQKEVLETAKKQWSDGMVRDQLSDELSHHQRRMYAMIFPNRAGGF